MTLLPTAGRFLYALPMAVFGIMHFMNGSAMSGMVPIPGGVFWVYVTGAALVFSILYTVRQAFGGAAAFGEAPFAIPWRSAPQVAAFVAIWCGYVFALPPLGFIVSTFAALAASMVVIRGRVSIGDLVWPAVFVIVLAVLLKVVLYVPVLPGWLDERLDVLIYSLR